LEDSVIFLGDFDSTLINKIRSQ